MRYVLGVAIMFAGFAFLMLITGGSISQVVDFVHMPSLMPFVITLTSVIMATNSRKVFIVSINAMLSKNYAISAADKEKSIRLYKMLGKTVTYTAIMTVMMGTMFMLMQLDDPSHLGPMISISLTSAFYGAFINLAFIYPAIYILETRYNAEEKRVISEKQVMDKLMELCYKQGITPEEILEATEINFRKN